MRVSHTYLPNEGPYLGENPSHGQVGLPLAGLVFEQLLQELQKLLSMLTSVTHLIQEAEGGGRRGREEEEGEEGGGACH